MNKKDMCTTKRIQRETNFTLPSGEFRVGMFIGKVAQGQSNGDMGKGLHYGIWGGNLPLVIPGERCSLSLFRRLLRSREPCLAGWGGWPSNMFTMSIRSILFRAVYKLSTAVKTCEWETQADNDKEKEGRGSKDKQQYHYNTNLTLAGLKRQKLVYCK